MTNQNNNTMTYEEARQKAWDLVVIADSKAFHAMKVEDQQSHIKEMKAAVEVVLRWR